MDLWYNRSFSHLGQILSTTHPQYDSRSPNTALTQPTLRSHSHYSTASKRKNQEEPTIHHVTLVRKSVPSPFLPPSLPSLSPEAAGRSPPGQPPVLIFPWKIGTGRATKNSANLARIRDNQRRSRARRKEYVQDLEARLRRVELQGVEAATEIQLAARRVADENRRLRALLNRHGVGDDVIEGYLVGGGGGEAAVGRAVERLEQLLVPRRPSCASLGVPLKAGSREASVKSDLARYTGWAGVMGHSSCGGSPLAGGSSQIGGPLPSPPGASGMHHVGINTAEAQASDGHSPYSVDYDMTIQIPFVQLSSPEEYNSTPVDYFGRPRGFTQGQFPC